MEHLSIRIIIYEYILKSPSLFQTNRNSFIVDQIVYTNQVWAPHHLNLRAAGITNVISSCMFIAISEGVKGERSTQQSKKGTATATLFISLSLSLPIRSRDCGVRALSYFLLRQCGVAMA